MTDFTNPTDLDGPAQAFLALMQEKGLMAATAESCTGGLILATMTGIAGSSAVVERGFITYSNAAKSQMLGVPPSLIDAYGAVSAPVALAMVSGALQNSQADIAISVTGIAGPDGGSADKPVGTVHFGCQRRGFEPVHSHQVFAGEDRAGVRARSVIYAFELMAAQI